MADGKTEKLWEGTNVTNLLRNRKSETYYARVKVNGKQKWASLETTVFSVAKLRLADKEKQIREAARAEATEVRVAGPDQMTVGYFIDVFRERTKCDTSIAPATRDRRLTAIKAVETTWPEVRSKDVRRLTEPECRRWAAQALKTGTGFIAPNVKTRREGMSASAFNKCVDAFRAVLEIARENGVIYKNHAEAITKAPKKKKRLELPTAEQFQQLVTRIRTAGSKWSEDCADYVRFLAYSGMRRREATAVLWRHVDLEKKQIRVPGTKTESSWRTLPLFPDLEQLLREIRDRRPEEPVDGKIIRVGSALGALDTACERVGLKKLTHHDLRHLFATRCIESGVDIPTVSRWLGHSDGGTLAMETYGHLRQEHSQAQATRVKFGASSPENGLSHHELQLLAKTFGSATITASDDLLLRLVAAMRSAGATADAKPGN